MGMVEQNGPKSAGKKPSGRTRTNSKPEPIKECVNLLGNGASRGQVPTIQPGTTSYQHPIPSSCCSTSTSTPPPYTPYPLPHQRELPPPVRRSNIPYTLSPMAAASFSSILPSMATGYFSPPSDLTTPQATSSQFSSVSLPVGAYCSASSNHTMNHFGQVGCLTTRLFYLKWVQGTRVSKYYGCGQNIQNIPQMCPDDLIVVHGNVREYRDRNTGQLVHSNTPQNVQFHLFKKCIVNRYPSFQFPDHLVVGPEFVPLLQQEHLQQLPSSFGLNAHG